MKLTPATFLSRLCANESANAEPFDEMKLSDQHLESKLHKLRTKGYFTIPIAPGTKRFLEARSRSMPNDPYQKHTLDFRGSSYEQTGTALATRVVSALVSAELPLRPQEFEIRRPKPQAASEWHQDKAPKFLTCLTTLEGEATEFVSPEVFKENFKQSSKFPLTIEPVAGRTAIEKDIRTTKPNKFYVFAALGVEDPQVPKLLHRAPGQAGRSIFLARWQEHRYPGEPSRLQQRTSNAAPADAEPAPEPKTKPV